MYQGPSQIWYKDKHNAGLTVQPLTIVSHARLAVCPCEYLDLDGDQLQSNLFEWDHTDCLTIKLTLSWPESYL